MSSPPPSLPVFYKSLFILMDILAPTFGLIANYLSPSFILSGYTRQPLLPPAPETTVLLSALSGFFASLALTTSILLYTRPHDLGLWRTLQAGLVVVDLFQVEGFVRGLRAGGRGEMGLWGGGDWGNVGGYAGLAVLRGMFVLGVGLGGRKGLGKGKKA